MNSITFYYDIGCPFAYIAAHRILDLAAQCNSEIIWKPILLGGLYQHHKSPDFPAESWPTSKAQHGLRQLSQEAERYDVPLNYSPFHPQRTVNAMRLLLCAEGEVQRTIMFSLFKAYWQDGYNFNDNGLLDDLAEKHGLPEKCYLEPRIKLLLRTETETAAEKGVFGVPTFEVNGDLLWGQDRMHFLRSALGGPKENQFKKGKSQKELTLYHDFASPFSYLGFKQMAKFQSETGHRVTLKPILLGAVFKEIGTPMVPLFTMSPKKQKYVFKDLMLWAEWWKIPFVFPSNFPLRSVLPLRVALIEPSLTDMLYTAFWTRGEDISQPEVIADICKKSGRDADEILHKAQLQKNKDLLKQNTSDAIKAGVCGVPSWDLEGEVWWGQDRLLSLASRLSNL
jgi:2-hydroxychromene-2-carboxylate isomerase